MPKHLLSLLPAGLLVQQTLPAADRVSILTEARSGAADCPGCVMSSRRVHSHYRRSLGDLPWQGRAVTLLIQAQRFRCVNPDCSRKTFAEQFGGVTPPTARRTRRLDDLQRCVGQATPR